MAVKGKYIIISLQSSAERQIPFVAGVKADRLRVAGETIEIASATSSRWKEFVAGRKEWSIETDYLITDYNAIVNYPLMVGMTYNIIVQDALGHGFDTYCKGTVICTEAVQDYQVGALVKGSFTFKGTGPLTY